ncbi:MAG TPA: acyltransferase [Alphaproteobacteria bacterium]|jgi:peptidoglycan/LPS O-acetylase OafA/YrhL
MAISAEGQVQDIPSLTSLRGLAALFVLLYHFCSPAMLPNLGVNELTGFFGKGYLWVDVFFVLSGFIITHVYRGRLMQARSWRPYKDFFVARFARIYPLHAFLLLAFLAIECAKWAGQSSLAVATPAFAGPRSAESFFSNLFLLHAFGLQDMLTWNGPSWSISAEWWAYMLFPLLIRGYSRLTLPSCLAGFGALMLAAAWLASGAHQYDVTYDLGFLRGLIGFSAGILSYWLYERFPAARPLTADWGFLAVAAALAALFHAGARDIFILPLFVPLILATARNQGRVSRLFDMWALRRLGEISYSVYLLQALTSFLLGSSLKRLLGHPLPELGLGASWIALACLVAATLVLATATWKIVELPSRRFVRGLFHDRAPLLVETR